MVRFRIFHFGLFIIYIILMTSLMIWQGIGIAPDRYAFVLLIPAFFIKKARSFLLDWIPFLFLLLSYDFLRGFADNLDPRVHFTEPIQADLWLFGNNLPTQTLQNLFYHSNNLAWYDFLATILYFLHFALPLSFGFLLWISNRKFFREFATGILLLSYAGWITYIAYPVAPPWLAVNKGLLSGISKIMDKTLQSFPENLHLPTIYHNFNPNEVAAIPSMHAAYPFIVFLFAFSFFKLRALWFLPYLLAVWISIVYLGEHYVIDVIAGAIYAVVFFFLTRKLIYNPKFHNRIILLINKLKVF